MEIQDVNNPLAMVETNFILEEEILELTLIPHQIDPENGGTSFRIFYGDGVKIIRVEGSGSGIKYIRD